jgi:hypothetical protein
MFFLNVDQSYQSIIWVFRKIIFLDIFLIRMAEIKWGIFLGPHFQTYPSEKHADAASAATLDPEATQVIKSLYFIRKHSYPLVN